MSASFASAPVRSQVRAPPLPEAPAVSQVALVATRNFADLPAASGTSFAEIAPSWFGVHAADAPSTIESLPSGASGSTGPHVPSALQKCEAHWSSVVQLCSPDWPQAAMLHCN